MNVAGIAIQPDPDSLLVAYRPVYFQVYADSVVGPEQPMYGDVYFNDGTGTFVYYKTFTSYSIVNVGGTNSVFDFDVQDAFQEYLKTTYIPTVTVNNIYQANGGAVQAYVNFRGSTYSGSVLSPNPVVPIQGTATTSPVSGTGISSNTFIVVNATMLQDYGDVFVSGLNTPEDVLQSQIPVGFTPSLTDQRIYTLSNMPSSPLLGSVPGVQYDLCPEVYVSDHGAIAMLILQFGSYPGLPNDSRLVELVLEYWQEGATFAFDAVWGAPQLLGTGVWYIPTGLKEIALYIPSVMTTLINPANTIFYRFRLDDLDSGHVCYYSPAFKACNKAVENKRLWFQNYWGHFEQLSFVRSKAQFKVTSGEHFVPHAMFEDDTHNRQLTGRQRYNVRMQDEEILTGVFPERLMPWVKELLSSPFVFMDVPNYKLYPLAPKQLQGFKVEDDTFSIRKTVIEGRINYEVTVKLPPALDVASIRN